MKRVRFSIWHLVFGILIFGFGTLKVKADECDNAGSLNYEQAGSCINKLQGISDAISKANTNNLQDLKKMQNQIVGLQNQIKSMDIQLTKLSGDIFEREVKIGVKQALLSAKVRQDYIKKNDQSLLYLMFSAPNAAEAFKDIAYREKLARQDREVIVGVSREIGDLNTQATSTKLQKERLAILKTSVDKQATWLAGEVEKASKYVADLGGKISALSARQQAILAERSGSFIASVGDSELADDYKASIKGFRESAPSGYFAVFSFGAYTHRKGMSQYGAKGRAQNGQNAAQIIQAYYGSGPVNKDTGGTISVSGVGNINFEDYYLMGIAEMPGDFPTEALKAQAIAARSYAYRYKLSGQSICTNEACQVFSKSKANNPPNAWKQAVQTTRGQVVENVVAYFSSTTGGYITTMGWDTTDGGGGSNFFDKTYEKLGGSPWAYKAWYRSGYSSSGDDCGRGSPWLSGEELADIVNAALVISKGSSGETGRITPPTCAGGNPYSLAELREIAGKYGGISNASSVSVSQGNGNTNQVTINGVTLSGSEFKNAFNLRAPGKLRIPQNGYAFFNIEKK